MRKTSFAAAVFFVSVAGIMLTSMAGSGLVSARGHIRYYGNAPVATPAFETDDGKVYIMRIEDGARCSIEEVLALQGNHIELTGTIGPALSENEFPVSQDGTFIITSCRALGR